MKRCVVIGGAAIKNYEEIKQYLSKNDFYIFCDSGLNHIKSLCVNPDLIVGDFDSHERPEGNIETIVLPREKDDTDTVYAVKEALKRGFSNFLLIGVVGGRFDHTLGNIAILSMLHSKNIKAKLIDNFSEMEIVSNETKTISDSFPYFSLLTLSGDARGVSIENAKYPLTNATITSEYQYGISNEVIKGKEAKVSVKFGNLLLIKIRHE